MKNKDTSDTKGRILVILCLVVGQLLTLYLPHPKNDECLIKGNVSFESQEKIYHLPGCPSYDTTIINSRYGEQWFCSENEAIDAGRRKAKNCDS